MESALCPSCGEPAANTCKGCGNAKYCSRDCQLKDWKYHKTLCKSFKQVPPRPSENHRLAVLFPAQGDKAEFIWLPVKSTYEFVNKSLDAIGWGVEYQQIQAEHIMGTHRPTSPQVEKNAATDAPMKHRIEYWWNPDVGPHNAPVNQALVKATAKKLDMAWYGPLIVYCGDLNPYTPDKDIVNIQDMDMGLYSDFISYIIEYKGTSLSKKFDIDMSTSLIAVQATCTGHRRVMGTSSVLEPYKNFMVNSLFKDGTVSDISLRINVPLLTIPFDNKPHMYIQPFDFVNTQIGYTHMGIDPKVQYDPKNKAATFGHPPKKCLERVGNMLIARLDRKPLELRVAEIFVAFCRYHLAPHFEWARDASKKEPEKVDAFDKVVLDQMTPDLYIQYGFTWEQTKQFPDAMQESLDERGIWLVGGRPRVGMKAADSVQIRANLEKMSPEEYSKRTFVEFL